MSLLLNAIDKLIQQDKGKWTSGFSQINYVSADGTFLILQEHYLQRARTQGYINGYRWGVAYNNHGFKPNLPNDTMVSIKIKGLWHRPVPIIEWAWAVDGGVEFKITDERYKPKDTSYLKEPIENPIIIGIVPAKEGSDMVTEMAVKQQEDLNTEFAVGWYDYKKQTRITGKYPAVGETVEILNEAFRDAKYEEAVCLFIGENSIVYTTKSTTEILARLNIIRFRPIDLEATLEKNRIVDLAISVFEKAACKQTFNMVAGIEALYSSGLLSMPQKK